MTLEEKVGQMIAWRYNSHFVNLDSAYVGELVDLVNRKRIGGLIIFAGEVYETAHLTNYLQQQAKIPLLVAADFEWGAAMRINGTTLFPPLMALGAAGSEELAYEMGRITAVEGRAMGIHMTYAPVVDVNINPDNPIISARSLGESPESVGRLAAAFIKGCQENGLIATAKHFPGHGDTATDSHNLMPTIDADLDRLEKVELYPFARAIEAGVEAVMTAHLYVPALDPTPGLPATLSPLILTDLLRKKLGFDGLIVTDAMGMGGITKGFSPRDAALRAVKAGVDMVLLPPDPPSVIEALAAAVQSGEIAQSRIDESVSRILALKARLGLPKKRLVDISELARKVASRENLRQAALTFEKCVTLVKNEGEILPLTSETFGKRIAVLSLSSDADDYFAGRPFVREVQRRRPDAAAFYADAFTGWEFLREARAQAMDADIVILALFSSLRTSKGSVDLLPNHIDLVRELTWAGKKTVVISFGSPYFLLHFPEVSAYACLYRNTVPAQEAAARAVFGEIDIEGRLPVSIPGLFPIGHGLTFKKK
ncbi:MAG TPA: glycoside hydrolase family 3 N-terminal domain-containing protein [Candidatus Desulfaltia sp.]|nr:glycoside hydrolase family 3 N-terminal domain-containing protein [Candidatus Desulfaltia sp.]